MKSDILVRQVRCDRTPGDDAYAAGHSAFCLAYVQRGSFAYHARGRIFEMVRGAAAIGHAGIEYTCTHDDSRGDDCLIFEFPDNAVELLGGYGALRNVDALPPIAEVAVFGELAQAVMDRQSDLALDEVGCLLLRAAIRASGDDAPAVRDVSPIQRSRVIDASHWLDAHSSDDISLGDAAAYAGISPYHFLRQFVRVVGVTPHQFIIRSRLRRAAYLLCTNELSVTDVAAAVGFSDLSNFIRSFRRAAGISPRAFRLAARGDRNFFQERYAAIVHNHAHERFPRTRRSTSSRSLRRRME